MALGFGFLVLFIRNVCVMKPIKVCSIILKSSKIFRPISWLALIDYMGNYYRSQLYAYAS